MGGHVLYTIGSIIKLEVELANVTFGTDQVVGQLVVIRFIQKAHFP